MDKVDEKNFTPLEPAFLIKDCKLEDLPEENSLLSVYIPVVIVKRVSADYFEVKTIQENHMYLSHKDLLIKLDEIYNMFN